MESINFNKKFIIIVLLMTFLFTVFFIVNVKAVNYNTEELMLLEDAEFYDENSNELGIKINKGEYLRVYWDEEKINGVSYKKTALQTNLVFIKTNDLDVVDERTQMLITNKKANIYNSNEKVIGTIDKDVIMDTPFSCENGYYEVAIDGLIKSDNLEVGTGQVGDLSEEISKDVNNGTRNFITDLIIRIIKLLFNNLGPMLNSFVKF